MRQDCSVGLNGRGRPLKCLSQSSFVFVATDTSASRCSLVHPPSSHPSLLLHRPTCHGSNSVPSLLISPFCLLIFLPRFCYALGTSLVQFFLPFDERARNCPARSFTRMGENLGADEEPVRTNAKGYEDSGNVRAPKRTRRKQETNKSGVGN